VLLVLVPVAPFLPNMPLSPLTWNNDHVNNKQATKQRQCHATRGRGCLCSRPTTRPSPLRPCFCPASRKHCTPAGEPVTLPVIAALAAMGLYLVWMLGDCTRKLCLLSILSSCEPLMIWTLSRRSSADDDVVLHSADAGPKTGVEAVVGCGVVCC
jgi:hypothetical protein